MMLELHPNYIEKKGKKEFVVIPYGEYKKIQELIEDYEDLLALRAAKEKEKNKKTVKLADVKKELNL